MSAQNKDLLIATINNLAAGSEDLYKELAKMTDLEIENVLNDILKKGGK